MTQDVDEVGGQLSIVALSHVYWRHESMIWDPAKYGSVKRLLLHADDVWFPQLALINPMAQVSKLVYDWTPIRVMYFGRMIMRPVNLFQSICTYDVSHYPFDTQVYIHIFTRLTGC